MHFLWKILTFQVHETWTKLGEIGQIIDHGGRLEVMMFELSEEFSHLLDSFWLEQECKNLVNALNVCFHTNKTWASVFTHTWEFMVLLWDVGEERELQPHTPIEENHFAFSFALPGQYCLCAIYKGGNDVIFMHETLVAGQSIWNLTMTLMTNIWSKPLHKTTSIMNKHEW